MAISSPGIGSGLPIQSIVSQLVAVESQPVKLLQAKSSALQTKLSMFGQIKSELSALQDAARALTDASTWDAKTFASDTPSVVSGAASSSGPIGTFSVSVAKLAVPQSVAYKFTQAIVPATLSDPVGNPLADGKLSFQSGTWTGGTNFAPNSGVDNLPIAAIDVEVKSSDTLTTLAARVNASAAGVTAIVVGSGADQQLIFRGNATGKNGGFEVRGTVGLTQFNNVADPVNPEIAKTSFADDAKLSIEDVVLYSHTNTVVDAVSGVTLNLLKEGSTAKVSVATDKDSIKTKIQAFQDAYNKLNADLKEQTKYDAATKTGAPLLGDGTTLGIQNMLRSLVSSTGPSAVIGLKRLSDLGLELQSDGSLKTNSTKLDAALLDPANVKAFFATNTGTTIGNGIAKRIYDFTFGANAVGGTVSSHSAAFQKSIDRNTDAIDKFNTHIAEYQKQLLSQYTRLDANMSTLNSLSTFVSQQVAQWNKTG